MNFIFFQTARQICHVAHTPRVGIETTICKPSILGGVFFEIPILSDSQFGVLSVPVFLTTVTLGSGGGTTALQALHILGCGLTIVLCGLMGFAFLSITRICQLGRKSGILDKEVYLLLLLLASSPRPHVAEGRQEQNRNDKTVSLQHYLAPSLSCMLCDRFTCRVGWSHCNCNNQH